MADETKRGNEMGATQDSAAPASAAETQPPTSAPAFADKATDLDALRSAVIDAAGVGAGLWLSYLFVLFYLAVAAGGVTHRDLFFENPVRLPFLNVDLPLIGFFVLGPLLFLIVHTYVLLHFALLAGKVGAFDHELRAQVVEDDARARLRRQLPSNIFVQFLAGPREVRTGVMGFLLRLVAQISLVAGPLALLIFFQLQFLPYHNEVITWWQRCTIIADLALLWMLWPSIARGETTRLGWRDLQRGRVVAAATASLAAVLLVLCVATFPGELLDKSLLSARFLPAHWFIANSQTARPEWTSLHEVLVAGEVDYVARKPRSLWSNRLVLPKIDVIDHARFDTKAKIAALTETISLRGRRLEGAVLLFAGLTKADFTAAKLGGAKLSHADLTQAKFECDDTGSAQQCADLRGASLEGAQLAWASLKGALLAGAQLQGANLEKSNLQGASLYRARLQAARLGSAHLQGANLDGAQLQGADLDNAQLQGASLDDAQLQGASLYFADLDGASLNRAQLQGASLQQTKLPGASLVDAQLQGARLDEAELQGASLNGAQLQGTTLAETQLDGASLSHSFVWRADAREAQKGEGLFVVALEAGQKHRLLDCPIEQKDPCEWSIDSFLALKRLIEQHLPEGERRQEALKQLAILDPVKPFDGGWEKHWATLERSSPTLDMYEKSLAISWQQLGCNASGAPHVIHGLLRQFDQRFTPGNPQSAELATAFLDEAHCLGARGLSEEDKARLKQISTTRPKAPASARATTVTR
jgi:uncharacterized protein YjbI with pentapeptide repeats